MAALAAEIDARAGDRVRTVHQDDALRFRFPLEGRDGRVDLVTDLDPDFPRTWLAERRPAPGEPSALANRLRHYLKRARLVGSEAVPGERALVIRFERAGVVMALWLELFGRQANLYLVDDGGTVVLTPRGSVAEARGASVGQPFEPTPPASVTHARQPLEESASSIVARMAAEGRTDSGLERARISLRRALRRALKSTARRVETLERQLASAGDAATWRQKGELLRASFHLLKPGLERVVVTDYTQVPPTDVEIELDPSRAPGDQIARCFARAKKLERGAAHAATALGEAQAELCAVELAMSAADTGSTVEALADLAAALPARLRREAERALAPPGAGSAKGPARRTPWREFVSADGWAIRVGKSARDNDELTLRGSSPHDLFVHVRGAEGSHVIVPTPRGKTVPKETLLDAAELACVFSKRAEATRNEVDYVERRYVRKSKGAPPGQVVLDRSRTLSVRRDDRRRERLLSARPR